MLTLKLQSRISKHKDSVITYLIKLDNECRQLRFELNDQNQEEIVKNIINKTNLQRKYRRYLKLINR
tara:strand:- start:1582 stop:1782 length:201 start_codon:yes stop_codon:yes gene_type:complete